MTTSRPEDTGAQVAQPVRRQPQSPQELREEIAHTREELAATVEALAAKADVKTRARERLARTKDQARQRFRRAGHKAGEARGQVQDTMSAMSSKAKETVTARDTGMMARRGSAVLAGAGAAMVVGALVQQSRLARRRTPWQRAVRAARSTGRARGTMPWPFMGRRGMITMKRRAQRKMIATRAVAPAKALTARTPFGRGISTPRGRMSFARGRMGFTPGRMSFTRGFTSGRMGFARGRMGATRMWMRAARRRAMLVSALGAAMVWLAKRRTVQHEAHDIERDVGSQEIGQTVG